MTEDNKCNDRLLQYGKAWHFNGSLASFFFKFRRKNKIVSHYKYPLKCI